VPGGRRISAELPESAKLLIAFDQARVRWLLIGRQALIHYGAPVQTMDYDVWADPDPGNMQRLVETCQQSGFHDSEGTWSVRGRELLTIYKEPQKVDIFLVLRFTNLDGEPIDFAQAYPRRVVVDVEGDPFHPSLPALEDLRRLKRMRDTEKDREDLRYIRLLQERMK
jgi:hypothetical protein